VLVSSNYFRTLNVGVELGRTFLPDEGQTPGTSPVAVISHNLWQRHFPGDANVVGKTLVLNGEQFTIIGVAPANFVGTEEAFPRDIWVPLMMEQRLRSAAVNARGGQSQFEDRNARWYSVM